MSAQLSKDLHLLIRPLHLFPKQLPPKLFSVSDLMYTCVCLGEGDREEKSIVAIE